MEKEELYYKEYKHWFLVARISLAMLGSTWGALIGSAIIWYITKR